MYLVSGLLSELGKNTRKKKEPVRDGALAILDSCTLFLTGCLANLLRCSFALLLAARRALLLHDRVVHCRALLLVHRVALLLVDRLALLVLELGADLLLHRCALRLARR